MLLRIDTHGTSFVLRRPFHSSLHGYYVTRTLTHIQQSGEREREWGKNRHFINPLRRHISIEIKSNKFETRINENQCVLGQQKNSTIHGCPRWFFAQLRLFPPSNDETRFLMFDNFSKKLHSNINRNPESIPSEDFNFFSLKLWHIWQVKNEHQQKMIKCTDANIPINLMNGIFPSFEFLKSAGGIFVGIGRQGIVGFAHFVSNFLCCRALFMSSFVSRFLFGFEDIKCAVIFSTVRLLSLSCVRVVVWREPKCKAKWTKVDRFGVLQNEKYSSFDMVVCFFIHVHSEGIIIITRSSFDLLDEFHRFSALFWRILFPNLLINLKNF